MLIVVLVGSLLVTRLVADWMIDRESWSCGMSVLDLPPSVEGGGPPGDVDLAGLGMAWQVAGLGKEGHQ